VKRRRLVIAAVAMVFAFGVGVAVAFRQLARAQTRFDPNKVVAATPVTTLITSPGIYRFEDLGFVLKVWIDVGGIVQYELAGIDGSAKAASTERASTYSRWGLVLDEKSRLWFYSGDIGTFIWDGTGNTSRPLGKDNPLRKELPPTLKTYAPRA
jgi:hypothetical protein